MNPRGQLIEVERRIIQEYSLYDFGLGEISQILCSSHTEQQILSPQTSDEAGSLTTGEQRSHWLLYLVLF